MDFSKITVISNLNFESFKESDKVKLKTVAPNFTVAVKLETNQLSKSRFEMTVIFSNPNFEQSSIFLIYAHKTVSIPAFGKIACLKALLAASAGAFMLRGGWWTLSLSLVKCKHHKTQFVWPKVEVNCWLLFLYCTKEHTHSHNNGCPNSSVTTTRGFKFQNRKSACN